MPWDEQSITGPDLDDDNTPRLPELKEVKSDPVYAAGFDAGYASGLSIERIDLELHQQLDAYSKVCSDLGKRLLDTQVGAAAIQKRENENLEELRALRRLETAVRSAILEYGAKGHVFANSHTPAVMKALSDLNALRGVK